VTKRHSVTLGSLLFSYLVFEFFALVETCHFYYIESRGIDFTKYFLLLFENGYIWCFCCTNDRKHLFERALGCWLACYLALCGGMEAWFLGLVAWPRLVSSSPSSSPGLLPLPTNFWTFLLICILSRIRTLWLFFCKWLLSFTSHRFATF